jgi:hypothetical protein
MKRMNFVFPIVGLAAILASSGCPSSDTTVSKGDGRVTTQIPTDDVSDLNVAQPQGRYNEAQLASACASTCAQSNLVEHDDFFATGFEELTKNVRVFSFRSGWGRCAITLTGKNGGGVVSADTYNKWDSNRYAEPKNLHFTVGKSNQAGSYCVENGSLWEKTDCHTQAPDRILKLHRIDKPSTDEIWISTYKGWKGTLMAKKSGILHPMACQ